MMHDSCDHACVLVVFVIVCMLLNFWSKAMYRYVVGHSHTGSGEIPPRFSACLHGC